MSKNNPKVLVIATSRKTRGGITSVIKAHETGEQWNKYHCRWIETHRDGNSIRKLWYLIKSLVEYITLLPFYDIVHIHIATTASAQRKQFFLYPANWLNKKVIFHFHPSNEKFLFEPQNKKLYTRLLSRADLVLVLSAQWVRWIDEALGLSENIQILYNPCPKVIQNKDLKDKVILFAGSVIKRKGYDVLIMGFALVAAKFPDWKLVIAGNGELAEAKQLASDLGVTKQVFFPGWVKENEKEFWFQKASIYCLTSDGEGFPMGVLDAWAYGIPCIMTPVGGIPDIVQDGINGLIFPVGDIDILSLKLEQLIKDIHLRKSIVNETNRYVYGEFSSERINNKLDEIYSTLKG